MLSTRFLAISALTILPVTAHASSLYSPGVDLTFFQGNRQSTWGESDASEISGTKFVGAEWDDTLNTGAIVGKVNTTTVPDITYSTRLVASNACKKIQYFQKFAATNQKTAPSASPLTPALAQKAPFLQPAERVWSLTTKQAQDLILRL